MMMMMMCTCDRLW